jgi:putative Mn2+ efflux pump MntP
VLWLSAVLIAVVSNLDNLATGVAFGMRDTRIAAAPNVVIAAVTMAATGGAMTSGRALSRVLSPELAASLGASIIGVIGVWTVLAWLHDVRLPVSSPGQGSGHFRGGPSSIASELDREEVISCRKALALGVALALNNAAAGIGAGVAGISPLATTLLAGSLSLICVGGGSRVGLSVGRLVGSSRAPLISGLILLAVGATLLAGSG